QHRFAEARAAYEHALAENLGFYMAHVRLASAALAESDTSTALNELETASLIRPNDPFMLAYYATILAHLGRLDDAQPHLDAALRADSDYALPHLYLGFVKEKRRDFAGAVAEYGTYLAHAPRSAPERAWAEEKLKAARERTLNTPPSMETPRPFNLLTF